MSKSIKLTKELKAAISWAQVSVEKHAIRFYLSAVLLQCKGGILSVVGTDGAMMQFSHVNATGAPDFEFILPIETVPTLLKYEAFEAPCSGKIRLLSTSGAMEIQGLAAKYPDWRRVVDRLNAPADTASLMINADLLARLSKGFSAAKKQMKIRSAAPRFMFTFRGEHGPISAQCDSLDGILLTALIMPMRR